MRSEGDAASWSGPLASAGERPTAEVGDGAGQRGDHRRRRAESGTSKRAIFNLVLLGLVALGFGAFVVQNTRSAQVEWLFFDGDAALWLVMVASAVAGSVLTLLSSLVIRRRRRSS